tara:strand:- start:923 stop:1117 length:195 start_codon:yes stop_codon:yes gene_type:complete
MPTQKFPRGNSEPPNPMSELLEKGLKTYANFPSIVAAIEAEIEKDTQALVAQAKYNIDNKLPHN